MPEIPVADGALPTRGALIPPERTGYLGEIAQQGREIGERIERSAATADTARHCYEALKAVGDPLLPEPLRALSGRRARCEAGERRHAPFRAAYNAALAELGSRGRRRAQEPPGADRGDHLGDVLLRRARPGGHRRQLPRHAERAAASPRSRRRATRGWGDLLPLPAEREPAGLVPVHGGVYPVSPRRRGSDPHVRRRGHARAHQPPLPLPLGRPARRAPLDRVRLGHALRRGSPPRAPTSTARSATRASRSRRRRREEALLRLRPLRAVDVGLDDDQRPGADHPRVLHERRDRPAGREAPARDRGVGRDRAAHRGDVPRRRAARATASRCPRATTGSASGCSASPATRSSTRETYERIKAETLTTRARHRAGRHPQGGPGPEHLHLLDRVRDADDGRRAGVLRRQRRAQLLQRLDQRLPHRRGRGEPDHPARVHARERLHDRRVLPRARHGDRRLRAEPVLLLLATAWTPSTR